VTSSDECFSLSAFSDGIPIPNPPNLAGKANREHSRLLGGGIPVRLGRR